MARPWRQWFNDSSGRRLIRNTGAMLVSRVVADPLNIVTTVLVARHLGPASFGILVLIQTYISIIDWTVNFQSWQALIKYGAQFLEKNDKRQFNGLVRFGFLLDLGSALVGFLLALTVILIVNFWWNWDSDLVFFAQLYSLAILFNLTGTPTAILRLFDRFRLLALHAVLAAALKLTGVVTVLVLGADFFVLLCVILAAEIAGSLICIIFGVMVLWQEGFIGIRPARIVEVYRSNKGIISFFFTTNIHGAVRMASKEIDMIIIGSMLGSAGAGHFKVVKQVASILSRISAPLYEAVYPELAKLWGGGHYKHFAAYLRRCLLLGLSLALSFWAGFVLFGRFVIELLFGGAYLEAFYPALIYLSAVAIAVATFSYHPSLLAMGKVKESFKVLVAATLFYFAVLPPLIFSAGLSGAAWAYLIFYGVWLLLMQRKISENLKVME